MQVDQELQVHDGSVYCMDWSRKQDEGLIFTGSNDQTFKVNSLLDDELSTLSSFQFDSTVRALQSTENLNEVALGFENGRVAAVDCSSNS